jgi:hypothetical protein
MIIENVDHTFSRVILNDCLETIKLLCQPGLKSRQSLATKGAGKIFCKNSGAESMQLVSSWQSLKGRVQEHKVDIVISSPIKVRHLLTSTY